MRFNVNDEIRVKLTAKGRELHRKSWPILMGPYEPPTEDADGWSRWQLWSLMSTFGMYLYNGCEVPFESEIDIPIQPRLIERPPFVIEDRQ